MWNAVIKYIRNYILKRSLTRKVATNSQIKVSIDSLYQKNYSLYSANRKLKSRFEVKNLNGTCIDIMESYRYSTDSHVSWFANTLKENILGLEAHNIGEKLSEFFNIAANVLVANSVKMYNKFYQFMQDTALSFR